MAHRARGRIRARSRRAGQQGGDRYINHELLKCSLGGVVVWFFAVKNPASKAQAEGAWKEGVQKSLRLNSHSCHPPPLVVCIGFIIFFLSDCSAVVLTPAAIALTDPERPEVQHEFIKN